MSDTEVCLIVDFGSQYTQLIARKLRELNVFSRIVSPLKLNADELHAEDVKALIISGGPASVLDDASPNFQFDIKSFEKPILGICYGLQWMASSYGGEVVSGKSREYGVETVQFESSALFEGVSESRVLMSHGDHVERAPKNFKVTAKSKNGVIAAIEDEGGRLFGIQFHPEVKHTLSGTKILENFLKKAGFRQDWSTQHIYEEVRAQVEAQVKGGDILCALSGGVDSTVAAVLLNKLFPGRVQSFCVDTGLLRKNEPVQLQELFKKSFHFPIELVDARERFLSALSGVTDPEQKRKTIGRVFIEVFEKEAKSFPNIHYLAQGTLYPDVIESVSAHGGPTAKIKSHHNVGGLPKNLKFELLEPFKLLFKDEVRVLGEYLGLPHEFVWRHPFPGPGLAVRVVGEVTEARLSVLKEADWILQEVLRKADIYEKLWQSFCVYLPIQSVGVMGDSRTYEETIAVRCVHSDDGMTAHIANIPTPVLEEISSRIINEVKGINRVVYDISSKPPSTIEWE